MKDAYNCAESYLGRMWWSGPTNNTPPFVRKHQVIGDVIIKIRYSTMDRVSDDSLVIIKGDQLIPVNDSVSRVTIKISFEGDARREIFRLRGGEWKLYCFWRKSDMYLNKREITRQNTRQKRCLFVFRRQMSSGPRIYADEMAPLRCT